MKLIPKYSYEFNVILNESLNETEQIQNFASLISDKDRFLQYLPLIEKNKELIEERLGSKIPEEIEFYVIRGEKFKSFSLPITIEYSILPEEMILFLLKEIIKTSIEVRFTDEETREQYINSFVEHIAINAELNNLDIIKFGKNLHDESKRLYPKYEFKDIDFNSKTLNQYIEESHNQDEY
jgi:hypothetical protein